MALKFKYFTVAQKQIQEYSKRDNNIQIIPIN